MITVEQIGPFAVTIETVPISEAFTIKLPRKKKKAKQKPLTPMAKRIVERYKDAYKRVYGVRPEVKVDGKWFRITGHDSGVNRKRLLEMARQLEYRAGSDGQ